jgi:hypothetical protein
VGFTWSAVENAIQSWVTTASGVPGSQVIWGEQNGPRPSTPFITLRISDVSGLGIDGSWQVTNPASTGTDGQEILEIARGTRQGTLTIQVFGGQPTNGVSPSPVAIAHAIVAAATLPATRFALVAAGVGLSSFKPIRSLDGVIEHVVFEPRAIVEVTINLASEVQQTETVIDTVVLTDGTTSPSHTVTVASPWP